MRDNQEQAYWAWCIHDALWERIKPLSPTWKSYPLGSHRPHVDDRKAMDAIFVVLCTGGQ
jgi:transposase